MKRFLVFINKLIVCSHPSRSAEYFVGEKIIMYRLCLINQIKIRLVSQNLQEDPLCFLFDQLSLSAFVPILARSAEYFCKRKIYFINKRSVLNIRNKKITTNFFF